MLALGYVNKKGDPDVIRFSLEHGIIHTYVYRWIDSTLPDRDNLIRLGEILKVSPAWLLFGDEVSQAPTRPRKRARRLACLAGALLLSLGGGTATASTPAVDETLTASALSAIRKWRYRYFPRQGFPRLVPARLCA